MDEAERRFRACADRFKRDLTKIVLRSIDTTVREALSKAAKEEKEAAKEAREAQRQAAREAREAAKLAAKEAREAQRQAAREAREAAKQAAKEARAAERQAAREARRAAKLAEAGVQLELRLDVASLRAAKKGPQRVRAGSILGAELAHGADGVPGDGLQETSPAPKPSERPLFVHRRARDGQIHALSRARGEQSAEQKPDGDALS